MSIKATEVKGLNLLVPILAFGVISGCAGAPAAEEEPASSEAPLQAVERLEMGQSFPPATFANLNPTGPRTIDLKADLGTRTIVLYYWIAGNRRSEEVFRDLETLSAELGPDRLALYGVTVPRANLATAPVIKSRLQMMGLRTPVLEDVGFTIGQRVAAERVPHISIVDASGKLRLTHGASLSQSVTPESSLSEVIRQAVGAQEVPTYGELDRYFPVKEMEGRPSPDFRAPLLANQVERSWRSLLDDEKVNVLVFWSVDCPHCREELPEINAWLRANPDDVNVVSCARASDPTVKAKTKQFCDANGFIFPTLVDEGDEIASLYNVTTTPTILIMGPDGIIDTAIVSHADHQGGFGETMERSKRGLLPTS